MAAFAMHAMSASLTAAAPARLGSRAAAPAALSRPGCVALRAAAPRRVLAMAEEAAAPEPEAQATMRSVKGSVYKVRRILDVIRGRDYQQAVMMLEFLPHRAAKIIQDTILSCAANAKDTHGMKKSKLFISETYADQGPYLRRFQPRAQGRAYPIRKPTCSIHVKMKSHETSTRIKGPIKIGTH